ncbi:MAG: winged helix-turn-helix transcriptional regulator [Clostridia bacterium]|nr:winged helix-turn-helix transcriptional regulator [Clostridia bacterium]
MTDTLSPRTLGWILCRDQRLSRLLEAELGYLGIAAVSFNAPPSPTREVCILLCDGDEFSPAEGITLAERCGCPLLVFGRETVKLPLPANGRICLRRPFALTEMEKAVRTLLADRPLFGTLASAEPPPKTTETPPLTARDGIITVGEHTVTLTPAEWTVFTYLYDRQGEAVSRAELAALLGGGGNSVDVYVCHLRTKIEKPLGRRMIWTVRGVGYRMEINRP